VTACRWPLPVSRSTGPTGTDVGP